MSAQPQRDAVERALAHHERLGTIRTWSPPSAGSRAPWRVLWPQNLHSSSYTFAQMVAICDALAAVEQQRPVSQT